MDTLTSFDLSVRLFLQLAFILGACRVVGGLARRVGQPQVVGEMVAGVLLGPSLFGLLWPAAQAWMFPAQSMTILFAISQVGLAIFMFLVGVEFRHELFRARARSAATVSLAGMAVPFVLGGAIAIWLHGRSGFFGARVQWWDAAVFLGAAMAITAFPMLARIIHDRGLAGTELGTLVLAAGAINDAAAWCLLALVLASLDHSWLVAGKAIGGGVAYSVLVFAAGRTWLEWLGDRAAREGKVTQPMLTLVLTLVLLGSWFTDAVGIYSVFGAFVLGVAMPRGVFANGVQRALEPLTVVLLLPLFFTYSGLHTRIDLVATPGLLLVALVVLAVACLGKGGACYLAARVHGEDRRTALAVATLMNARGLMELVLLNIGLQRGIIQPALFTIMVLMAIVTTLIASPLFEWTYGRHARSTGRLGAAAGSRGSEPRGVTEEARVSRRRNALLYLSLFLIGAGSAVYEYWPALTTYQVYHSDVRQSPHWAAYHNASFRTDDILVEYARFNESPLQNAIYFVATWFGDYISVSKCLSVSSNGLSTCWFFFVGRAMYGIRAGFLLSMFFTFAPSSFRFAEGFFSKFWAAPLLLLGVWILHTGCWRGLLVLLPLAALAYPMMAVLIGSTCGVHMVMLWFSDRRRARALFGALALASSLAVLLLSIKYARPPGFIGPMLPRWDILQHPIGGAGTSVPIPSLLSELGRYLAHPFVIASSIVYVIVLRRDIVWERCWTALLAASIALYVIADLVFVRLYVPDRYTQYSIAVLLVLWQATNVDRVLARIPHPARRYATLAAILVAAGWSYHGQAGRHASRSGLEVAHVARFIRTLPDGILLAGPPAHLDDIAIQSKRSVLSSFKLNHGWYVGISGILHERTLACFRAIYAPDEQTVNELHTRYGVTHIVVDQSYFGSRLESGGLRSRYDGEILREVGSRSDFLLVEPPEHSVIYDDGTFMVLELPLRGS